MYLLHSQLYVALDQGMCSIKNVFVYVCLLAEWKILKNRKFLGSVNEQNIRGKSRPVIEEIDTK